MFEHHDEDLRFSQRIKPKRVFLIQNGSPEKMCMLESTKKITKFDIIREVERKWGNGKYKAMKLFTIDAIEYNKEDLDYIKDGEKLYISRGILQYIKVSSSIPIKIFHSTRS